MNFSLIKFKRNGKDTSQVIVAEPSPDGGTNRERLEASTNENRAINRAMTVIDPIVRKALLSGKTVRIEYEGE